MTTASLTAVPHPQSIAATLERQRLEHRARRLRRVLAALDERRLYRADATGTIPPALRHAIHGFTQELDGVERRIAQLGA